MAIGQGTHPVDRTELRALTEEVAALPHGPFTDPGDGVGDGATAPPAHGQAQGRAAEGGPDRAELPWCGGVVVLAGQGDQTLVRHAAGWALRWTAHDRELPPERRDPVTADTLFDLASVTKLFTTVAAMRQVERGALDLDEPVARRLPEFGAAGKAGVTVRQLLTHTSGLRPELPFHEGGWPERLWSEAPLTPPGDQRTYSDLNLLTLHLLLERVTGRALDQLVTETVTGPLGMTDTGFGPVPPERAAATEDQYRPWAKADRGLLRGHVHDENAAALGGVAGHAGLFSTADDLARLCRALLAGGGPVLSPASVELLLAPPGLGFVVDQPALMGELAGRGAAGHSGFTGTSLVLDRDSGGFVVLLATTVHPVRPVPADSRPRARAASRLARALRAGAWHADPPPDGGPATQGGGAQPPASGDPSTTAGGAR